MNPLENVWTGLVQRRLLPVAILLLAAIVAIPFLLSKDPESVPPAPTVPTAETGSKDQIKDPVVSLADASIPAERRRVLGAVKDPFMPAKAPKPVATPEPESASAGATATTTTPSASGGSVAGSGATSPSSSAPASTPSAPAATPAPTSETPVTEKKETYTVYSAVVRYGNPDEGEPQQKTLTRLTPLPDSTAPAVLYFGVGPDDKGEGKAAYFYVADDAELDDESQCRPSVRDCQGIILGVGDKAKLNLLDPATGDVTGSYVVELVKIKSKRYDSAEQAKDAYGKSSKIGRSVLRAHKAAVGPLRYRYEVKSGLVRKLDKRAYRTLLAKSARVALGTAGGF